MSILAFCLVVLAALAHATWNLLAKRAAACPHLILFSSLTELLLLAPFAAWIVAHSLSRISPRISSLPILLLLSTGVLHLLYTDALLRGYRSGDLSLVYPLARGTGPLLAFFGAILLLHEHPSALGTAGALLVTAGILLIAGVFSTASSSSAGFFWGLASGCIIACYTLVDAYSVKVLLLAPLLVDYSGNLFRAVALLAGGWRQHRLWWPSYKLYWREATAIGILTPAAYILILEALRRAPVTQVAPARELSMIIGVLFGARFLQEGNRARRLIGAAIIGVGVAALALG